MQYYHSVTDANGFVHSIDNAVFVYFIKGYNMDRVAKELAAIRERNSCDGWDRQNCQPCSKYSWYQNVSHIGAVHISFGKMQSLDKVSRMWTVLPMLRLEANPNKHYGEKAFQEILEWVRENCTDGVLKKYDYAVDVPYKISDVLVYNSRKEAGLYKGTVYRGQRSQHGFMKIYDKAKEQKELEAPLTRIEHTLEAGKPPSLEHISLIGAQGRLDSQDGLDGLNRCIVTLCLALQSQGVNFEPYISSINYRRRKTIEPYLYGGGMELKYDEAILKSLLDSVSELFHAGVKESAGCASEDCLARDSGNDCGMFAQIDESIELPFD